MWNAISLVKVWTHVAVSISYDDNHYITVTSKGVYYERSLTLKDVKVIKLI